MLGFPTPWPMHSRHVRRPAHSAVFLCRGQAPSWHFQPEVALDSDVDADTPTASSRPRPTVSLQESCAYRMPTFGTITHMHSYLSDSALPLQECFPQGHPDRQLPSARSLRSRPVLRAVCPVGPRKPVFGASHQCSQTALSDGCDLSEAARPRHGI
ncbi:uncharacterized protein LAESUDRAFT_85607 [Laetiporus sulphureus 93-53]|uniref:Uncharacterized protein n=1 Tax=Laetiporus sulphureus 93-53 TaxID=1314785 RepID=A0A165AUI7_9APHY|nr:uncharacterized protein LAESUDRAFT_85607 [Laetiporus sulphureus 93-53]KZS99687.1 hypothetical protein LAESUDRAFT_85607 [Laetiporus sulphureus 93-53]